MSGDMWPLDVVKCGACGCLLVLTVPKRYGKAAA